jgi:NAD+ synthetase
LVGFVRPAPAGPGAPLEDAAALLAGEKVQGVYVKSLLPNYDVYDDPRYFRPGAGPRCFEVHGCRFGVTICEDLWDVRALGRRLYALDPVAQLAADDTVEIIVNIAASGYQRGKVGRREALFARQARRSGAAIIYVNQVGGNDGMVFDGGSCAVSPTGELLGRAASFKEDLLVIDTSAGAGRCEPLGDEMTRLTEALKLGLRDYVRKADFHGVVLGLAEDLESAVVAALAVESLGPEHVCAVAMPDSSNGNRPPRHCTRLADHLGIELQVLPIARVLGTTKSLLQGSLSRWCEEPAGGEIPALLGAAALSVAADTSGRVPLVSASKTDLALGRFVPVRGALAPVGDVFSTDVVRLAKHLNTAGEKVPRSIVERWPGSRADAVLNQSPPQQLDEILSRHIEQGQTAAEIAAEGFDSQRVDQTLRQSDRAEHSRRQAPTVLQVSDRAFGFGRRIPVARRYPWPRWTAKQERELT